MKVVTICASFAFGFIIAVSHAQIEPLLSASRDENSKYSQPTLPERRGIEGDKAALAILGKLMYSDKRLSRNRDISCATCHDPAIAFADHNALAVGANGETGTRNVPTILNASSSELYFRDGRSASLEDQALQPLLSKSEMGMESERALLDRLSATPEYRRRFKEVFGPEGVTISNIVRAISTYERTLLSSNSPFDRFIAGDRSAISEPQRRGWELFQRKAKCITCHEFKQSSPFFIDFKFHNTGVAAKALDFDQLASQSRRRIDERVQSDPQARRPNSGRLCS